MGLGFSSAFKRMLHELEAHLALHPDYALLQLDYKDAFNLVSQTMVWAVLSRALPAVSPYHDDAHVTAWVDALADEHGRLLAAIEAPPPAQLQAQLLLLRVCASPRANYWLPALPLVWGARLAG
eukprot:contig_15889_g3809